MAIGMAVVNSPGVCVCVCVARRVKCDRPADGARRGPVESRATGAPFRNLKDEPVKS